MADTVENLIFDLLQWVGRRERTYQETMDAWRTSCPRLPVWENASDRGLVETKQATGPRSSACPIGPRTSKGTEAEVL
jgi:D-3-phosphoglycerate dehydrogenase